MNTTFEPFLFDFYLSLRAEGQLVLDDMQYVDFLRCFLHTPINDKEELRFLCKTIWVSSPQQLDTFNRRFNAYFGRIEERLVKLRQKKEATTAPSESKPTPLKPTSPNPLGTSTSGDDNTDSSEQGNSSTDDLEQKNTAHDSSKHNQLEAPEQGEINLLIKDSATGGGAQSSGDAIQNIESKPFTFVEKGVLPFNTRRTTQALRKLPSAYVSQETAELDTDKLFEQLINERFIYRLDYQTQRIRSPQIVWLSDHDGSMNPFRNWEDALLRVITNTPDEYELKNHFSHLDRYFFHDFPSLSTTKDNFRLFHNRAHTEASDWLRERRLRKWNKDTLFVIFSDAAAAHRKMDFERVNVFFEVQRIIKNTSKKLLWINPVKQIEESSAQYISYFTEMIYPDDQAFQRFVAKLPPIEHEAISKNTTQWADFLTVVQDLDGFKDLDTLNQARLEAFWESCPTIPHRWLLCHAAYPVALTSDLVQQLWYNFPPKNGEGSPVSSPISVIDELLHSSVMREIGHDLYEMYEPIKDFLLRHFESDSHRQVAQLMHQYITERGHRITTNALKEAERLNYETILSSSTDLIKKINQILQKANSEADSSNSDAKREQLKAQRQVQFLLDIAKRRKYSKGSPNHTALDNLVALTEALQKAKTGDGESLRDFVNTDQSDNNGFKVSLPREVQEGLVKRQEEKSKPKIRALVVGVGSSPIAYNPNILGSKSASITRGLTADENSADLFADTIEALVPNSELQLTLLTGEQTTKTEIKKRLNDLLEQSTFEDNIVVYLAADAEAKNDNCYIKCYAEDYNNVDNRLSNIEIYEILSNTRALSLTLILQIDHAALPNWIDTTQPQNIVFASSKFEQLPIHSTVSVGGKSYCVFTYALTQVLEQNKMQITNRQLFADTLRIIEQHETAFDKKVNTPIWDMKAPQLLGNPQNYRRSFLGFKDKAESIKADQATEIVYNDFPSFALLVFSDPSKNLTNLKNEKDEILKKLTNPNIIPLVLDNPDKTTLAITLQSSKYLNRIRLFYYSGMDDGKGNFLLQNNEVFTLQDFAKTLDYQENMHLFVSNTCRSFYFAEYLSQMGVKMTIGAENEISDYYGNQFGITLLEALNANKDINDFVENFKIWR